MRVVMAGPYDPKGRYEGGICNIINDILDEKAMLGKYGIELIPFDTCRIKREGKTAKLSFENVANMLKLFTALPREIRKHCPEALYFHTSRGYAFFKDLIAIKIAHCLVRNKPKTILHIHFADYDKIMPPNDVIRKHIINTMNRYLDEVVFLSRATEKEFIDNGLIVKTKVLYNYGNLEYNETPHKDKTEALNLLFVGSIDKRKGLDDLVSVLQNAPLNAVLHICGGGNQEAVDKVKDLEREMPDRIVFHGFVSGQTKQTLFNEADILVLPSYGEGLPIVIMEALQTRCAIVSTNVGAIPEIVTQDNGILIDPGDQNALYTALNTYDQDREFLERTKSLNLLESEKYSKEFFIQEFCKVCG